MPEAYLVLAISAPRQTVQVALSTYNLRSIELIAYSATGLTNTSPLFFSLPNQACQPVYGNVTQSSFPLLFGNSPNDAVFLSRAIDITGTNRWNNAGILDVCINDVNNNPGLFTQLVLIFSVKSGDPVYKTPDNITYNLMQA